tara:strand:- start:377 stop:1042 length:666 start_codon:yes stop_codon:yes gene_type:complete
MKALKNFKAKIVDPLAGGLGKGSLRDSIGGFGGGKLQDAMQGLGKSKFKLGKLAHGGRMRYGHGGRMSNRELGRMLSKYMGGGRMKYEHGGAHGGPQGDPETADPFENFSFETALSGFQESNPNLVNPKMDYYMIGDERTFLNPGDDFHDKVVMEAHGRGVKHMEGDRYSDIFSGLMDEFERYAASLGEDVDPAKVTRMREAFADQARNYAGQVYDATFNR